MTDLESIPAAGLGGVSLTLRGWLAALKSRGRLRPLLADALAEEVLLAEAARLGLAVPGDEVQRAADDFRRRHGLTSADLTREWLAREGLTADGLADGLRRDLLLARLADHVTGPHVAGHFAADPGRYDRAWVRVIVVGRAELARELLAQVRDDGADFGGLARRHSTHGPSRDLGGCLGVRFRHQLPAGVADAPLAAGAVLGPVLLAAGHHLLLVEQAEPATLDARTAAHIRGESFDRWRGDLLRGAPTFPLLERV